MCGTYRQHPSERRAEPCMLSVYLSIRRVTHDAHSQVILLLLAQVFQLGVALNHGAHGDADIFDFATSGLDERSQSSAVGVGSVTPVGNVKHGQDGVRLGPYGVVRWEICQPGGHASWTGGQGQGKGLTQEIGILVVAARSITVRLSLDTLVSSRHKDDGQERQRELTT